MKRFIALLLGIVMVILLMGCGDREGEAGKNKLVVSSAKASAGEEVIITITASDKTPVSAYELELSFDPTQLELLEYGMSERFEENYHGINLNTDSEGMVKFAGANVNQSEERYQGEMGFAKFKIIGEKGTKVTLPLEIVVLSSFEETGFEDQYTVENGTITIE